jgi:hypothetical protein
MEKKGDKRSRRDSLRTVDHARRSQSRKRDPRRQEKRITSRKRVETKTKGRHMTGEEKERRLEYEMNAKPNRERVYMRPVVHVRKTKRKKAKLPFKSGMKAVSKENQKEPKENRKQNIENSQMKKGKKDATTRYRSV